MSVLHLPDDLADRLERIARRMAGPGSVSASRSDVIAAAVDTALENGGLPALRLAFLRASVDASAARHERRRLAAARAGGNGTEGGAMRRGSPSAASVLGGGWGRLSADEQRDAVDQCIRCIRLDPDVELAALAARVGASPQVLKDRLSKRGFRRDRYGVWMLPAGSRDGA